MSPCKSILITGCSAGGIGATTALVLAKRGHHIFATARTTSKIPEALSSLDNVTVIPLDVASTSSVAGAVAAVTASGRGLDILINNAGAGYAMPVLDIDIDRAKEAFEVNLWGPLRTIQAFADLLIEGRGRVVNISTCGALAKTPWIASYCASKAALNHLSEVLRLELIPFGVGVVTILAGNVYTKFHDNDPLHLPAESRYAPIEDIIAGWASGASKPSGCSVDEFAEQLANVAVSPNADGLVLKGPWARTIDLLARWSPAWVETFFFTQKQGISELTKVQTEKSKDS